MSITVKCAACQRVVNAADKFAGKTIRCPDCKSPLPIPVVAGAAEPVAAAASVEAAPLADRWFFETPDGRTVGPLTKYDLDQWAMRGMIHAQFQVWQEGWPKRRFAYEVYASLVPGAAAAMGDLLGNVLATLPTNAPLPGAHTTVLPQFEREKPAQRVKSGVRGQLATVVAVSIAPLLVVVHLLVMWNTIGPSREHLTTAVGSIQSQSTPASIVLVGNLGLRIPLELLLVMTMVGGVPFACLRHELGYWAVVVGMVLFMIPMGSLMFLYGRVVNDAVARGGGLEAAIPRPVGVMMIVEVCVLIASTVVLHTLLTNEDIRAYTAPVDAPTEGGLLAG